MNCAIIFGGTGFIGCFFSNFLTEQVGYDKIYLADFESINNKDSDWRKKLFLSNPKIEEVFCDVRNEILLSFPYSINLIVNLAAIHREPGHDDHQYFKTNLLGAENICKFAEKINCKKIIFTSSIAPYGASNSLKNESTLPIPVTAYGSSKLLAEKIHQIWQAKDSACRKLVIVRPGVVFGPSEGGNVSRLIKAVLRRYFIFMGNRATRKAGVYVKELCHAMWWVLNEQENNGETVSLFNMSMNPSPSIGDYVSAVCKTQGKKFFILTVPYRLLISTAQIIDIVLKPFGLKHPFSPIRIRKLMCSNHIIPFYLMEHGYIFQYSLESAFADWKKLCPDEWQ